MTTARVTITLPAELRRAAQEAADAVGIPFSAVVSDALAAWVRGRLVDAWLAEHQAAHGAFDEDELRALAEDAGVPYVAVGRSRPAA
jgi:post-segregation antitoxin (ccd killing protein)